MIQRHPYSPFDDISPFPAAVGELSVALLERCWRLSPTDHLLRDLEANESYGHFRSWVAFSPSPSLCEHGHRVAESLALLLNSGFLTTGHAACLKTSSQADLWDSWNEIEVRQRAGRPALEGGYSHSLIFYDRTTSSTNRSSRNSDVDLGV